MKIKKSIKILLLSFVVVSMTACQNPVSSLTNASRAVTEKINQEKKVQENKAQASLKCQELCQAQIAANGKNFESGPCLSEAIIPDWVCDLAHQPRQPVDNEIANQCNAFRTGQAHHFVEVDGNCNVIKVY